MKIDDVNHVVIYQKRVFNEPRIRRSRRPCTNSQVLTHFITGKQVNVTAENICWKLQKVFKIYIIQYDKHQLSLNKYCFSMFIWDL